MLSVANWDRASGVVYGTPLPLLPAIPESAKDPYIPITYVPSNSSPSNGFVDIRFRYGKHIG